MKHKSKFLSILLLFIMTAQSTLAFTDVPDTAWYLSYVNELKAKKIIDDVALYHPSDNLKRAELVKMVIMATDGLKDYQAPAFPTFDDVPKDTWFSPYVEEAVTRKIVNGYSDAQGNFTGLFGPGDTVTRAAAVKVMVRAFDLKSQGNMMTPAFSDVMPSDWFYPYLDTAASLGIIEGYGDATFQGDKEVSRSEIAKMLVLSMNGGIKQTPTTPETPTTPPVETPTTPELPTTPNETPAVPNAASLQDGVVLDGQTQKFVARYNFKGNNEGFAVDTVTVVNDVTGSDLGDDAEGSAVIKNVWIKYPDKNGFERTAKASLNSNGTARFSSLQFFVKRDVDTFFEIYADLNSFAEVGPQFSGEVFRLGLKNVGASTTDFKGVGEYSSSVVTLGNGGLITSNSDVPHFIFRKTKPLFSLETPSATLTNGTNNLINLKVTADAAGSLGLARLVFKVDVTDADNANLTLSNFRLFADSSPVDDAVIYDATGGQDLSVDTLTDGASTVIVSFDQTQTLTAGQSKTYHLRADVTGSSSDDSVNTALAINDQDAPLTGLTAYGQENTGKIFVNGDATAGIFTNATDFSQTVGTNRNVIWSDFSFVPHQYPTVVNGTVTTATGSADWTNGYELELSNLTSSVLSK